MISQTYPDKNVKHDKKIYGTLKKQQSVNIHIKFQENMKKKKMDIYWIRNFFAVNVIQQNETSRH